jgi:hypothetical protein
MFKLRYSRVIMDYESGGMWEEAVSPGNIRTFAETQSQRGQFLGRDSTGDLPKTGGLL